MTRGRFTVTARRLEAQLLAGPPARDPVAVAARLLAVQAQDPRGARLAIRSRSIGLSSSDVDQALTADRSLVITTLNRGTLHLVRAEDYHWLHALTTPPLRTAAERRLGQVGLTSALGERGVGVIERSLADEGPLTRAVLAERIGAAGVPLERDALTQLLFLAAVRGVTVRGPMVGRQQALALAHDWVGRAPPIDRAQALAELARRYLSGHGPASDRDLARWAGLPLRDARAGLATIASELEHLEGGLVDLAGRATGTRTAGPRLLGAFDPVLLGWASREHVLGARADRVVTVNGLFRPFALAKGHAVGVWRLTGGIVELEPFAPLAPGVARALDLEAADVRRFLA